MARIVSYKIQNPSVPDVLQSGLRRMCHRKKAAVKSGHLPSRAHVSCHIGPRSQSLISVAPGLLHCIPKTETTYDSIFPKKHLRSNLAAVGLGSVQQWTVGLSPTYPSTNRFWNHDGPDWIGNYIHAAHFPTFACLGPG